jgi:hypothetical protein
VFGELVVLAGQIIQVGLEFGNFIEKGISLLLIFLLFCAELGEDGLDLGTELLDLEIFFILVILVEDERAV